MGWSGGKITQDHRVRTTERPAGPQGRDNGLMVQMEVEQISCRHRPSTGNKPK